MESRYNYKLSQKAENDLDNIICYIVKELSNPTAASSFINNLNQVIYEIRSFPKSGSIVNNEFLLNENIRKKLLGNYIMYYLPVSQERMIYILRIVYAKRNMDEILLELSP